MIGIDDHFLAERAILGIISLLRIVWSPAEISALKGQIIGHNTIFVDDRDPLAYGFQIK
ncbi:hypothetical protein [Rhizobium sp. P44RR-XXIV]|uniref:hypothetical protein n=1 Tax=Rhizobium sp. P44RR-XXIV TaxID=1921145 RepID=UPI00145AE010|nr:hypothetical protein [Rhizobium sp. P44RR-XXIV]